MFNGEFDNSRSIYMQIIDMVRKAIATKELRPGDKTLSQREFAVLTKVNPNTVQRAYRELENMGILETRRGQGTFVVDKEGLFSEIKAEMTEDLVNRFIKEMRSLENTDDDVREYIQNGLQDKEE